MIKKLFIALLLAVSCAPCMAQRTIADLLKNGTKAGEAMSLAKEAVSPELYIIRQQYRLERNGKTYGKNGKSFYGETYSLGIKVSGGMYVTNAVTAPWKGDADYERVNADGKYATEYFWTYSRPINDSIYKATELDFGTDYITPVNYDKTLWLHQDLHSDFGLTVDNVMGEKKGFLIWAVAKPNAQDSAMVVELRQSTLKTVAEPDSQLVAVPQSSSTNVIGGLFVVPKYEKGGVVKLLLAGVAVKAEDGKWWLQLIADVVPTPAAESTVTESSAKPDKASKKKKKKDDDSSEPTPTK